MDGAQDVTGRRRDVAIGRHVEQTQDAGADGAQDVAGRRKRGTQDVAGRRKYIALVCDVIGRRKHAPLDGTWNRRRTRAPTGLRTLQADGSAERRTSQADGGTFAAHRTGDTEWGGCELWRGLVLFLLAHPPLLAVVYFVGGASDIFEVKILRPSKNKPVSQGMLLL